MTMKNRRGDDDFEEEIRSHLELEADRLVEEEGLERLEAMRRARRAFGNVTAARERFYESQRFMLLDHLRRDLVCAFRQLKSAPASTLTVVLSLALGIGVNTAIFSLADQALFRSMPVEDPENLVQLDWNGSFVGTGMGSVGTGSLVPYLLYRDLRKENEVFEDMFARSPADVHVMIGDRSEPAHIEIVTGSYFPTLGIRPALGRLFDDADDRRLDGHPVVVLSHDYWRQRFGADPGVVGRTIRINDYPMTVIGVADAGFQGMDWAMAPAIWVPAMMKGRVTPGWNGLMDRRVRFLHVFGRLAPGIDAEKAEAGLEPWFKAYLRADTERDGWPQVTEQQMNEYLSSRLELLPASQGPSFIRSYVEQPMKILFAATSMVLLLACLNVANLSVARVLARRRTTALRSALGASRSRILMEIGVESALLALAGCGVGLLLAPAVGRAVMGFMPRIGTATVALHTGLDPRMLAFAFAVTVATTLVAGAAPALYAVSVRPLSALKEQSGSVAGRLALRKTLVIGQFALALVLLVCAALFAQTLGALRERGPGFATSNLLIFRLSPLSDGYDGEGAKQLFRRLLEDIQSLPDVEHAGLAAFELLQFGGWGNPVIIEGDERTTTPETVTMNAITPDFFPSLGVSVVRGRNFDDRDSRDGPGWDLRSAIVNEAFVRRYLPDRDPIGLRLGIGTLPETVADKEIVGVVSTFHSHQLRTAEPQIYFPLWERSAESASFYVRSRASSDAAAGSLRSAVASVDPHLTVLNLRTLDDHLDRVLRNERMLANLALGFALAALLLAMIGLYGVLYFSAVQRRKEIGIRYALGASHREAVFRIVREASRLTLLGAVLALPASWAFGRLIAGQLFGVRPLEPGTFLGATLALGAVCLLASACAARKLGSSASLEALRSD